LFDHLQLIKFWPSRTPGKGVCGGVKIFGSPYYSQQAVFASPLSVFSIRYCRVDADIQTTDPAWYHLLISPLNDEHKKDMEEVFRHAEQKKAAAGWSTVCPLITPPPPSRGH